MKKGAEVPNKTTVCSRIIAVHAMKETSDAITFSKMVSDKLLVNDKIRDNLIGIAHDNAPTLCRVDNRMFAILNRETDDSSLICWILAIAST